MEEQFNEKFARDKFRQWHFWWLIVFSLLLIVTFVWYLPTRFLQQFSAEVPHGDEEVDEHEHTEGEEHMMTEEEMHEHMDEHMGESMSMDEMMEHMMQEHGMMQEEAEHMMDEMMGHEHEGESADHDHGTSPAGSEDEEADHGHETSPAYSEEDHGAAYFEENEVRKGLVVNLNINPVPYNVGAPLSMDFFVNQKPNNTPILANQLQVEHEKLMHVIGVRSDMNEFFHIHPEFLADNPSVFSVEHRFSKPGLYKIWSEIKKDGVNYAFGHPEVNVVGAGQREEKDVSFSRNVLTGLPYAEGFGEASDYQVSMSVSDIVTRGREIDLSFDIHTLTGQEVNVEEYLGADMHLSIIKDDWSQFIHTHPEGHDHSQGPSLVKSALAHEGEEPAGAVDDHQTTSGGDEVISFHTIFPEAGLYKIFAQFRPEGIGLSEDRALLAEFWIQVEEKPPFPISQWWFLLIISAVLIAGLSWWVKSYLKVRPEDVTLKK